MESSHDTFVRLSVLRAEIRICVLPNTEQMAGFRVCNSVHHHTFNGINQPDAANSQVHYLSFNPLSPELNPICYLLALLAHDFLHVSSVRVKSLTHRFLMSYIYIYIYIYDISHLRVE
jgi:hypothetical protein